MSVLNMDERFKVANRVVMCVCVVVCATLFLIALFLSCRLEVFTGAQTDPVLRNFAVFKFTKNKVRRHCSCLCVVVKFISNDSFRMFRCMF